jgi:hypothetical protein
MGTKRPLFSSPRQIASHVKTLYWSQKTALLTLPRLNLQAGGRRFDPGWLHKYLQMGSFDVTRWGVGCMSMVLPVSCPLREAQQIRAYLNPESRFLQIKRSHS